jgi:hypothetical protein
VKIHFNETRHIFDEIEMGHKIFFSPCNEADTISATANSRGFTPLTAIVREFQWDRELIRKASEECNLTGDVMIVNEVKPTLLLVPKTRDMSQIADLTKKLIDKTNAIGSQVLHFTHFGFTQGRYPTNEMKIILIEMGYYTAPTLDIFARMHNRRILRSQSSSALEKTKQDLASSRRKATLKKIVWDYDFRRTNSLKRAIAKSLYRTPDVERAGIVSLL